MKRLSVITRATRRTSPIQGVSRVGGPPGGVSFAIATARVICSTRSSSASPTPSASSSSTVYPASLTSCTSATPTPTASSSSAEYPASQTFAPAVMRSRAEHPALRSSDASTPHESSNRAASGLSFRSTVDNEALKSRSKSTASFWLVLGLASAAASALCPARLESGSA